MREHNMLRLKNGHESLQVISWRLNEAKLSAEDKYVKKKSLEI